MAIRSLRLRPSFSLLQPSIPCIRPLQHRQFAAQSTPQEQELAAQAELAAKSQVLSPYHKVSYDERKVRIPWQDGKTSSLYAPLQSYSLWSYVQIAVEVSDADGIVTTSICAIIVDVPSAFTLSRSSDY
jgi:hypothetical protein